MTVDLSKLKIMNNTEDKSKKFKIPEKSATQAESKASLSLITD